MDLQLDGKAVLIAGGSRGFGLATARQMASEGAKLLLVARDNANLKRQAKRLEDEFGAAVATMACDLKQPGSGDEAVAAALERFGHIDAVVSSVGNAGGGIFDDIPEQVWNDAFALKFMGNVRLMQAAVRSMRKQQSGRIVIIAGQLGRQPHPRLLPSGAANAALLNVIKGVADSAAADGVIINAVNPGPSRTQRWNDLMKGLSEQTGRPISEIEEEYTVNIPLGRFGEPEEIARHVCFLASPAAGYITGTSITADGGWIKASA